MNFPRIPLLTYFPVLLQLPLRFFPDHQKWQEQTNYGKIARRLPAGSGKIMAISP
jgi:hypothetical protein